MSQQQQQSRDTLGECTTDVHPPVKCNLHHRYSTEGINAAVDVFGSTLRSGYNTSKADSEDVFLQTMTMWTDNGAATLGAGWHSNAGATPPPVPQGSSGVYGAPSLS